MALLSRVLQKGIVDLGFFIVVFALSLYAFSQLFYEMLGPVLPDFATQVNSFVTLFRGLFGKMWTQLYWLT